MMRTRRAFLCESQDAASEEERQKHFTYSVTHGGICLHSLDLFVTRRMAAILLSTKANVAGNSKETKCTTFC